MLDKNGEPKPWSVVRFLLGLTAVLGGLVILFDKAASPGMKLWAKQAGDSWVETGKRADALDDTSWMWNLGLTNDPARKWSNRERSDEQTPE